MKQGGSKILILSQWFHPEYVTSSTLVTQLAEDLAAKGLDIEALCGQPKEYTQGGGRAPAREPYKGLTIRRAGYLQLSRKSTLGRLINYFSFVASVALRWPTLLKYRLILVYSLPPLLPIVPALLNLFFGRKFVFVCYDLYPDLAILMGAISKGSLIDRVMRFTNRLVYRRAEKIVAIGDEMKQYMLRTGLVADENKIEIIPNWYEDVAGLHAPLQQDAPVFSVVYSGNMGICQDMDTILGCAALLRHRQDIRFSFAGHGNKTDDLKARVERENLTNVTFHGYLMGDAFAQLMSGAHCFIVSLERGMEGMAVPSKTYSYLAAGRPVVAIMSRETDVARMLEQYGAGYTVENGDAAALAKLIEQMAADRAGLASMAGNARKLYEDHYRRENCTGEYEALLRRLTADGGK